MYNLSVFQTAYDSLAYHTTIGPPFLFLFRLLKTVSFYSVNKEFIKKKKKKKKHLLPFLGCVDIYQI